MRPPRTIAISLPLAACLFSACADTGVPAVQPVPTTTISLAAVSGVDGPVMRHRQAPVGNGGDDAEIVGVLELDGDCLRVRPDSGQAFLIVWPGGTSWESERRRVQLSSGESIGIGERVRGGGGFRSRGGVHNVSGGEGAELADSCGASASTEVAVVNNGPAAIRPDR